MKTKKKLDFRNSRVAWFVVLETAKDGHDFARAVEAKQQLARLGVDVTYKSAERGQLACPT